MFKDVTWVVKILAAGFLGLLAYLPFHAVISTWLISNFGHALLFKSLKEIFLLGVLFPLSAYIVFSEPKILKTLIGRYINRLIFAYVGFMCVVVLLANYAAKAEIAGLVFNLRFFAMFMLAQILLEKLPNIALRELSLRFIFWGGLIVVVFGALQFLVLPNDILRHVGYRASIIPAYFTVDSNQNYVRILSTLRGPNILGAYLVFWLPFLLLVTKRMWHVANVYRFWAVIIWAASLIALFGTRSRSAWLGAILALVVSIAYTVNVRQRKKLLYALGAVCVGVVAAFALTWNSNFIQTTLWHSDPAESNTVNSDNMRQDSLQSSIRAILGRPTGFGVGTVNIASTYGNNPVTVENYYLQITQELGIVGIMLFLAIVVLVGIKLWKRRADDIAAALFAGLLGISVIGMFLPVWGDETLSMLWWGMAGLATFMTIKKSRRKSTRFSVKSKQTILLLF